MKCILERITSAGNLYENYLSNKTGYFHLIVEIEFIIGERARNWAEHLGELVHRKNFNYVLIRLPRLKETSASKNKHRYPYVT